MYLNEGIHGFGCLSTDNQILDIGLQMYPLQKKLRLLYLLI